MLTTLTHTVVSYSMLLWLSTTSEFLNGLTARHSSWAQTNGLQKFNGRKTLEAVFARLPGEQTLQAGVHRQQVRHITHGIRPCPPAVMLRSFANRSCLHAYRALSERGTWFVSMDHSIYIRRLRSVHTGCLARRAILPCTQPGRRNPF